MERKREIESTKWISWERHQIRKNKEKVTEKIIEKERNGLDRMREKMNSRKETESKLQREWNGCESS